MCMDCWENYGSPRLDTDAVRVVVGLIEQVYDYNAAGGGAHIVLDDWNIEDDDIRWCIDNLSECSEAGPERVVTMECLSALLGLTLPERASALAMVDGFVLAAVK